MEEEDYYYCSNKCGRRMYFNDIIISFIDIKLMHLCFKCAYCASITGVVSKYHISNVNRHIIKQSLLNIIIEACNSSDRNSESIGTCVCGQQSNPCGQQSNPCGNNILKIYDPTEIITATLPAFSKRFCHTCLITNIYMAFKK